MNGKILVIDSSVAVKWLQQVNEKYVAQADKIIKNSQEKGINLFMPELAIYEIGNALVYHQLELPLLLRLIERFYMLPITFVRQDLQLAQMTIEVAHQNKITYYDSSFIALAQKLKAPLVTDNPKHQKKKISRLKIISLKDYR